ncbi:hypothetical protein OFC63_32225, partial [Escherichia coli]|nr:hypothetical protein [Escherichia coli]
RALAETLARVPGLSAHPAPRPEANPWQQRLVELLHSPLEGLPSALDRLAALAFERLELQGLSLWVHDPAAGSYTLAARVPKLLEP